MGNHIDITGQTFGRLLVLERTPRRNGGGSYYYRCRCSCGTEKDIVSQSLRYGLTTSCGCYRVEQVKRAMVKKGCRGMFGVRRGTYEPDYYRDDEEEEAP